MWKMSPWMLQSLAPHLGRPVLRDTRPETAEQAGPVGLGIDRLAKVYVEVTTRCNLACRTCVRNAWDERLGHMSLDLYGRLMAQLEDCPGPLTLVFAGYGEPTFHPQIVTMLQMAKEAGARVEIVTNGMRLDATMAQVMIDLGVDKIWFSVDGVTPGRYAAIRRGGQLDTVREHIQQLYALRRRQWREVPEIGLVFVAMKSNIGELPDLHWLAASVHASDVLVTNLLPHSPEMVDEILYRQSLSMARFSRSPELPRVHLPRIDFDETSSAPLVALMGHAANLTMSGADLGQNTNYCPFVQAGAASVRWDGQVSPCPPLLHTHPLYVADYWKQLRHASFGSIAEEGLHEIWVSDRYAAFRRKVRAFDFAPCAVCGGCERAEGNEEDCCGNTFPTCGGCLWAQGIVRCP